MGSSLKDLVSKLGASGMPSFVSEAYVPSWNAYQQEGLLKESTPRDRVISVLGFLHLMIQAGVRKLPINPYKAYEAVVADDLGGHAETLARELRKMRIFDLFRLHKSDISVLRNTNGSKDIIMSFCVTPKRNEPLNNTLNKAEGFLYQRDLPIFLQERWKKMNIKSKAVKPKSLLPKSSDLMKNYSSIGKLPILIGKESSLFVSRAADDKLVFMFKVLYPNENINWLNQQATDKLLRRLWTSSFKSLQG